MAITRYSSFDVTVNTIADRNDILRKVNHMTVLVRDAVELGFVFDGIAFVPKKS